MSQIFSPRANQIAKASLVMVGALAVLLGAAAPIVMRSDWATGANTNITQPIQFSHAHHVGGLGIDCRYCHTTVETSSFANVPPTKTCMNCHSQIWVTSPYLEPVRSSFRTGESLQWTRVHNLPDFVQFNHAIHIKKGMGCETCHGRVDQMAGMFQASSLQMEWCLDCHRQPEKYVRPREAVFAMGYRPAEPQAVLGRRLVEEYHIQRLTTCSTCHR
jgi:hypothetical protein